MASAIGSPWEHLTDSEYPCLAWQVHRAELSAYMVGDKRALRRVSI